MTLYFIQFRVEIGFVPQGNFVKVLILFYFLLSSFPLSLTPFFLPSFPSFLPPFLLSLLPSPSTAVYNLDTLSNFILTQCYGVSPVSASIIILFYIWRNSNQVSSSNSHSQIRSKTCIQVDVYYIIFNNMYSDLLLCSFFLEWSAFNRLIFSAFVLVYGPSS